MKPDPLPLHTDFGTIRRARPADIDGIVRMVGKLAAHHGDIPALTAAELERDLFGENPWIHVLVAEAGSDLVGYAAMCGLVRLQFGIRGMDMHHLFTEAEFRGRGVGRSLVDACRIHATVLSCRYLTVGAHPDNQLAQAFYESLGFARRDARSPRFSMSLES